MTFDTYFRITSYAMIASGTLALAVSGGMGTALGAAFALLLAAAWKFEGTRWQLSERAGMFAVVSSLPLLYLDWKFQSSVLWAGEPARAGVAALTHFILFLSAVKLAQVKADRDWLFLYLISFFEVLLAAGLSVSPLFVATLALYTFCALSTVVCFEIRKARRAIKIQETRLLSAPRARWLSRLSRRKATHAPPSGEARRLPLVALSLLALIFALALPIFFIMPRFSGSALARADGGLNGVVGFSDEVTLGEIGRLQQSQRVVMRVRVEDPLAGRHQTLRWRGVALDEFGGRTWRRSSRATEYRRGNDRNLFQFGTTQSLENLTTQTFFIEPIDTPVLFIASRPVAIQGALPYIGIDDEDALTTRDHSQERISYRAYSDTTEPPAESLRADLAAYPREMERYLRVPDALDPRIRQLARGLIVGAHAGNRYDAARVIESYFQQNFRYTLEQKSGGAQDPLADFMFRVREGHCEYFSTAMAVMLRTAGVATRVVNGFQLGEYNDAADVYTVRQSDAHSWVEVYFPETGAWVTFDPTPVDGRPGNHDAGGLRGRLGKYAEALELLWIQYVVAYDKQEQRSLATSIRSNLGVYRQTAGQTFAELRAGFAAWWQQFSIGAGGMGGGASRVNFPLLIGLSLLLGLLLLFIARARRWELAGLLKFRRRGKKNYSSVVFYERMIKALEARGLMRAPDETPLEFAATTGMAEATLLTRSYNRVRFGAHELTTAEAARIEEWLRRVEKERE
ncbi:MAG: protein-glutamine gamma-glutamyltransferase [Pyrinomonadaceae bacterium]|nr:protein-glutamine gamma-glutamyltransferase [Pyrinomonadaceae bacterium]